MEIEWKNNAIASLAKQKEGMGAEFPLRGVAIAISLRGKHHRGSDIDNIAGSLLDALVQSKILKNDNMSAVTELSIRLEHCEDEPLALIEILAEKTFLHTQT
jgi:Holliday junction resolvase RusA-like endonuclease